MSKMHLTYPISNTINNLTLLKTKHCTLFKGVSVTFNIYYFNWNSPLVNISVASSFYVIIITFRSSYKISEVLRTVYVYVLGQQRNLVHLQSMWLHARVNGILSFLITLSPLQKYQNVCFFFLTCQLPIHTFKKLITSR